MPVASNLISTARIVGSTLSIRRASNGKEVLMTGPVKYTKEVVKEGKRVRWPHREELVPMIIVVVVISVFAAIFLALEDLTAGSLISQLKTAFGGK